jgi:hypothetical protein
MRQLLTALFIAFVVFAPNIGHAQTGAGAGLFNKMVESKCNKPDSKLIKPGTTDTYNAQAKGFNDCLRIYVESENNKIARTTADATVEFDRISASSNGQIGDIERAINNAILEVQIVNGKASPLAVLAPGDELTGFPAPVCARPDEALLKPPRGKLAPSLQSTDRYEAQRQAYEACVRRYIVLAKNEITQISANARISFKGVADDANIRIIAINDAVSQALADARAASGERDAAVNAVHSPLTAGGLSPEARARLIPPAVRPPQNSPGTESVTVTGERLPRSADMPTGAGDPDGISCRAAQQLPDSRMMGPEICKHNRDWAALAKAGKNISGDGKRIVPGEKQMTYNPQACITTFSIASHPEAMVTTCGTPGGQ